MSLLQAGVQLSTVHGNLVMMQLLQFARQVFSSKFYLNESAAAGGAGDWSTRLLGMLALVLILVDWRANFSGLPPRVRARVLHNQ